MDTTVLDFMKGKYNLMIYISIDISILNHFSAMFSFNSEIILKPFKFTNGYDGSYLLFSNLAPLDQNSIIIGLE